MGLIRMYKEAGHTITFHTTQRMVIIVYCFVFMAGKGHVETNTTLSRINIGRL
jgi:hypothetical protein